MTLKLLQVCINNCISCSASFLWTAGFLVFRSFGLT